DRGNHEERGGEQEERREAEPRKKRAPGPSRGHSPGARRISRDRHELVRLRSLASLYLSGTTTPTVVGQPAVMSAVALVIWSSVGRKAPVVSGSFALRSAEMAFRFTMSS